MRNGADAITRGGKVLSLDISDKNFCYCLYISKTRLSCVFVSACWKFLDPIFKIWPTTEHGEKFCGDQLIELGDTVANK